MPTNETRVHELNSCAECFYSVKLDGDTVFFCARERAYMVYENCTLPTRAQYIQQQIKEALGDDNES